jgi:hypothetical protein
VLPEQLDKVSENIATWKKENIFLLGRSTWNHNMSTSKEAKNAASSRLLKKTSMRTAKYAHHCVCKQPLTRYVHYALRRTLVPWRFDEALKELVESSIRSQINEVIVKIDAEDFSHGMPTLKLIESYQPHLLKIKKELKKINVEYSLNPWVTLGHCDRGRDNELAHPEIEWLVGHDGVQCRSQACPLSTGWRDLIRKLWTLYAQTHPHVLWIEDDIRTFNHNPVTVGCFCKNHLRLFSERVNETVTRDQLVSAICRPGEPHPWRTAWLELQGDIMVDTAKHFERIVHAVSPETCLGLMSSGPCNHAGEGRKWDEFAAALKGLGQKLYSRPPLNSYNENSLRGIYAAAESILHTRSVMPEMNIVELTEVDNWPYSRYSKSNVFTFLQMAISIALGCEGVTLNLYDHCGTPMQIDNSIETMLSNSKPFLNSLANVCINKNGIKGVSMLSSAHASKFIKLESDRSFLDIRPAENAWQVPLNSFGVPTTYNSSGIVAVSGQVLRQYSDQQLKALMSRSLLLDARAALVLQERGFASQLGLHINRIYDIRSEYAVSAEEFFDPDFGGASRYYMTVNVQKQGIDGVYVGDIEPSGHGRVLSRLVDTDAKIIKPMLHIYQNELGGRIAVLPYDLEAGCSFGFYNHYRKLQIRSVLQWLNKGQLDFCVSADCYTLPIHMDTEQGTVLGCFNLSLDDYPEVIFSLALNSRVVKSITWLNYKGEWQPVSKRNLEYADDRLLIRRQQVIHKLPLFLYIVWQ